MKKQFVDPLSVTSEELKGALSDNPTKKDLKEALNDYPTKADLKRELSNYPTKQDLRKELSNYPTKDDLKEALSNYPTKDELSERLTTSFDAFRGEMDHKLFAMEERLNEKIATFANKILTAIDPLLKELDTRQQDREIATDHAKKIEEQMETHDVRITKLEQITTAKTN